MGFANSLVDLSALIVASTAVLIYFGKVIADTQVEKYEKTDLIISGLFFTLIFLLFPLALNIFFYQKGLILNIPLLVIVLFHLIIIVVYSFYRAYKNIKMFELEKEYDKRFDTKIDAINKGNPIMAYFIQQRPDIIKHSRNLFDRIFGFFENGKILLLVSILIFYSLMISINNTNVLSITIITILSFINLTMIAMAQGMSSAYHPPSKITLTDGKTIDGTAIKFGEFIYLIKKGKKYFINKDNVKIIEQNIMKKKDGKQ